MRKPCIVCGVLTETGSRCETHQAEQDTRRQAARNTPERKAYKRQMYGSYYKKQRKAILATATHCAICGKPFQPGDRVETDHIYPSQPFSPLQATHRTCNQHKSNKQPSQ